MTHRGPFQPLLFCDSVISFLIGQSVADARHVTLVGLLYFPVNSPLAICLFQSKAPCIHATLLWGENSLLFALLAYPC